MPTNIHILPTYIEDNGTIDISYGDQSIDLNCADGSPKKIGRILYDISNPLVPIQKNSENGNTKWFTIITDCSGDFTVVDFDYIEVLDLMVYDCEVCQDATLGGEDIIYIQAAASDETTALTTGTAKVTFRVPTAFTLTGVRASLTTAQASGSIFTVDINQNGTSLLSTKLTIDNTEKTSVTAATAAVISTSVITDDSEITVDIDQVGNGTAKGLKITLIGTR
jgi:hypothetical protein